MRADRGRHGLLRPGDLPDGLLPFSEKVPWILYQFYGDRDILEMAYPSIPEARSKKHKPWNVLIDTGFIGASG